MGTPKITYKGDKSKSPWDFTQPVYDDRSSCYMNAGTHRGVGKRQPVGHEGNPKERVPALPFGRPKQMKVDEKS
jgi:hypothetical protein